MCVLVYTLLSSRWLEESSVFIEVITIALSFVSPPSSPPPPKLMDGMPECRAKVLLMSIKSVPLPTQTNTKVEFPLEPLF